MRETERFKKTVTFEKPDMPLRWYTLGYWKETKELWQKQNNLAMDVKLQDHFNLSYPIYLPGNTGLASIPYTIPFEEKIIEENEDTRIIRKKDGIIRKENKRNVSMPQWLSFPVESKSDWYEVKKRINSSEHDYGEDYVENIKNYTDNEGVNCVFICGIYGFQRYLLGEENLAYSYHDMPDVIKDMSLHWLEFYSSICKRIILDSRVDFVLFFEDMAYKNGPLIGPDLFKEFMTPYYKEMIGFFKGMKLQNFMIDCDGNVETVLALFNEVGINMMDPFEQAAGNDIIKIRDKYPELVIWGGIDKRVLTMTKEDIKREVYSKVPYMWEKGGFIPSIDHSLPPCPMENFLYYIELLDEIWETL